MAELQIGDVVQFNEKHKWCGCLGFINDRKECGNDVRYMIGVPVPQQGTAYIFSMRSAKEVEYIGNAIFVPKEDEE